MSYCDFSNAQVVVAEPSLDLRRALRGMLNRMGFRQIIEVDALAVLEHVAEARGVDMMICSDTIGRSEVTRLISDMRHHRIGKNPFIPIISLISHADATVVRGLIDAGADDILLKPVSQEDLTARIRSLTLRRKPFVVTSDYTGPDRRKADREGSERIPRLTVPNPLHARAVRGVDSISLQQAVDSAAAQINEHKLVRHAVQVAYLVERIVPAFHRNETGGAFQDHLTRLCAVAEDLVRRQAASRFTEASELCNTLAALTRRIGTRAQVISSQDIALLPGLSLSVTNAFTLGHDAMALTQDVAKTARAAA